MASRPAAAFVPSRAPRVPALPRNLAAVLAGSALLLWALWPEAAAASGTTLFRIILKDGTAVTSYGEYARVGDRVVFSMPLGSVTAQPRLELVSLPVSTVDLETTERYAEAVRYQRYVETRAEEDFAILTGEIAGVLNDISQTSDAARRLELAEGARRTLMAWPREHYGYRSNDVRDMVALLDEAISGLRAAAGADQFALSLVAVIEPPTMPLLPPPSLAQTIEQALTVARAADNSVERSSLLRSVIAIIDESERELPPIWARITREAASTTLNVEVDTNRKYALLARRALASARNRAANADVRGVDRVLENVRRSDKEFGGKRPEDVAALIAAVEERLDAARRLRLAKDCWELRAGVLLAYRDQIAKPIEDLNALKGRLADIRSFAGPSPRSLPRLRQRLAGVLNRLSAVAAPKELEGPHAMLLSACHLARQALETREKAVLAEDMRLAWDASAAAAGSMMLLAQAWAEMQGAFRPPEVQ